MGQNGSAEAIVINVSFKEKKIISDLRIYFDNSTSVNIIKNDQNMTLIVHDTKTVNKYTINYDQKEPISALYEIKNVDPIQ